MISSGIALTRRRLSTAVPVTCSASEAFVETLVAHKVEKVFGIVGSAFIDPLDLFPAAGIDFIDVQHEQNAVHMADSYSRMTGKIGVAIGQNGPGISNMVTGVATAYLTHAPVCVITPQSGADSMGKLGFQELNQLPMFSPITKYQVHVEDPARVSELLSAALNRAQEERGPTQLNYSRNILNTVNDYRISGPTRRTEIVPSSNTIKTIVDELLNADKPVLLAGGGLDEASGLQKLAARFDIPVATTYLHNDCFPKSDPRAVGALGYMGSQAAMRCVQDSDLVIAVGSRLNPFGTTPQYGMSYWDAQKPLIQIDKNRAALGVSCNPTIPVHGDAAATVDAINAELDARGISDSPSTDSLIPYIQYRDDWFRERTPDIPVGKDGRIAPKMVLETLRNVLAGLKDPVVTTDIGHCCSQSLAYLEFEVPRSLFTAGTFGSCGTSIPMAIGARFADANRPVFALVGDGAANMQGINELLTCKRNGLGITIIVFRNEIWGAELLNQLIWTDARTVGTEIENPPFKGIAEAYGVTGVTVSGSTEDLEKELKAAATRQTRGETTLIEVMCTPNMGAPFRSDAMSCPTRHLKKYKHLTTDYADYERQFEYSSKK
jgi:sulfoacetaldehyde acetyltransferase|eukprot:Stramenopile-MAST_4_protein_5002